MKLLLASWTKKSRRDFMHANFELTRLYRASVDPHPLLYCDQTPASIPAARQHLCQNRHPRRLFMMGGMSGSDIPVPEPRLRDLARNASKFLPNFAEEDSSIGVK